MQRILENKPRNLRTLVLKTSGYGSNKDDRIQNHDIKPTTTPTPRCSFCTPTWRTVPATASTSQVSQVSKGSTMNTFCTITRSLAVGRWRKVLSRLLLRQRYFTLLTMNLIHGPNNYKDTKPQMSSLLGFNRVYRLEIHSKSCWYFRPL